MLSPSRGLPKTALYWISIKSLRRHSTRLNMVIETGSHRLAHEIVSKMNQVITAATTKIVNSATGVAGPIALIAPGRQAMPKEPSDIKMGNCLYRYSPRSGNVLMAARCLG
jgi:hypothetical protein